MKSIFHGFLKKRLASRRIRKAQTRTDVFHYDCGGEILLANQSWYRGEHASYLPNKRALENQENWHNLYMDQWSPDTRLFNTADCCVVFGSGYGNILSEYLHNAGIKVIGRNLPLDTFYVRCPEGRLTSAVALEQINLFLHQTSDDTEISELLHSLKQAIKTATVFLFILSHSDDVEVNSIHYAGPGNIKELFSRNIATIRRLSFEENLYNLNKFINLLKSNSKCSKVILAVSPSPLVASHTGKPCLVESLTSKSRLSEAMKSVAEQRRNENVYYFPSFEFIQYYPGNAYADDMRHLSEAAQKDFIAAFACFCNMHSP